MKKRVLLHRLQVFSIVSALFLQQFVPLFSVLAFANAEVSSQQHEQQSAAQDSQEEIIELRTQNSKTFRIKTETGEHNRLQASAGPIHFLDAEGNWQDIDTTVVLNQNGEFTNTTNSFTSVIAANTQTPTIATVTRGDFVMRVHVPVDTNVAGQIEQTLEGEQIKFPAAMHGLDVAFRVKAERLVKEFVFPDADSVLTELPFVLTFAAGGSAELVENQIFLKQHGQAIGTLPVPMLYETTNRNRGWRFLGGVDYRLEKVTDQSYQVTKVINESGQAWLDDSARQYPIAVDATLNLQVGASADDAQMGSITTASGRSVTTSGAMDLVNDSIDPGDHGTNNEFTAGMRFTNVTLANAETINTATLTLSPLASYDASPNVVKFHLSAEAVDDAGTFTSSGGNLNTTARPRSTADSGPWTQTTVVSGVDEDVAVTTVVQEIVNRGGWASGNDLVIIIDTHTDSTLNEWQEYYSYDGSTTLAPRLSIDYGAGIVYEQEGYRFRADDGNETTATWLANQDTNITRATETNTRLRMLVNTTLDSPSNQYQLEYKKSTDAGYQKVGAAPSTATPTVQTRSTGASAAANATTHSITMPASIAAGDLLLLVFSSDGNPDMSIEGGGWIRLDQAYNSTIAGGAVFYKFAEGSDTATVTTSVTEQTSHVVLRISGAGVPYSTSSNGSSTNSDPPNLDAGTSRNHLWVATRSGDSTVVATVAPTGYSNLQSQAAAGTGGASTNTAEKAATASSEDPGTFTSATEQWASFTIAVPPADTVPGPRYLAAQSSGTTSLSLAYPAGIKAGDLLVMSIANKHTSNAPSTPTGWTAPSNNQASGTSGSDGIDTGSVYSTVFTKIADGTETGNASVTITSGNSATGNIISLRAASGKVWTTALTNGSDTTVDTAWSVTGAADPGITAGDIVITASGINTDAYLWTAQSLSATSVTFASHQEMSEGGTANGNDLEMTVAAHRASSGTSSAAPVFTMTSSGSATNAPVGATVFVRARQVDAPIVLVASTNITASGDNTTAQLTAPSGKTTSDFVTGRMQDDENPADAIDITTSDYTELEWSIKATSTATNGDVYTFRITIAGTALTTYTVTPQITIGADSTFTLSSYRWYVDNDSENVSAVWGNPDIAEDTALTLLPATNATPVNADELRLRVAVTVGTSNLSASSQQFKLQYKAGTDESCTTGSWTDVGASGGGVIWRYATSSVTDGTTLTVLKLTVSDVLGVYAKASPTATNPNGANIGQDIEYDFHVQQNAAGNATVYSFRVVESDGTVLGTYTECPTLSTRQIVDQELRHGNVFGDEIERGFTRVD